MEGHSFHNLKLIAVTSFVVLSLFVLIVESGSFDSSFDKISVKRRALKSYIPSARKRFVSLMLRKSLNQALFEREARFQQEERERFRRDTERELSKQDEMRIRYEERLFRSLNVIGTVPATRLYVPEYINDDGKVNTQKPFNIEIGTVVGKVRKLFPHGKQLIVWPYEGWRNFSINEDTGEVKTTAKLDFELIRLYNMTIRDFRYNYSNPERLRQPPVPDPVSDDPRRDYIDHYLIVEVVDRNDHTPTFTRDTSSGGGDFSGDVNTNALAGTRILYLRPEDDDSGPRGRIRFNIRTTGNEELLFTIDPKTHFLKTTGLQLKSGEHRVGIEALDYGMPPKSSSFQEFTVRVGKTPPEFTGAPYNLNFSEASVPGSVVQKVNAISRSGFPLKYEIITEEAKKTFMVNHLGEIVLLRPLDYDDGNETDKLFTFEIRATENVTQGRSRTVPVTLRLLNADDHLGMFKTPATRLEFKEGEFRAGGDVYKVEVVDCDCKDNCECKTGEMLYTIGDTKGFFDVTSSGQIRNTKDLDYEEQNYFFFPVKVTDPGKNGRTRTSYVEIIVKDVDDTAPKFPKTVYDFAIFEDAPKDQVIGVVQAEDPDPATLPDQIAYRIDSSTPAEGIEYFAVGNQGVITVLKNTNQFEGSDSYEFGIKATDSKGNPSDPIATVTIRVLDVNDHQPIFKDCKPVRILENQDVGTVVTTLTATDKDRGVNKLIEYSIEKVQKHNFFKINNSTGEVTTTEKLDREKYDQIFVVATATDGGADRSEPLRQVGYCQFIVTVEDVNDHHPMFTVQTYEVTILRTLPKGRRVLDVLAIDPDLGDNAKIVYAISSQKRAQFDVQYLEVVKTTGQLRVKNSMSGLDLTHEITVVIQATNPKDVVGPAIGPQSKTTVIVKFTNEAAPVFTKTKYVDSAKENIGSGTEVLRLSVIGGGNTIYSLQTIRDRDNLPFVVDSTTGVIKTKTTLDFEQSKYYIFAVTAQKPGKNALSSAIVEVNIEDIDDVVPTFGNDRYEATVSEAAGGGVNVFRVQASDPDPVGGKIIYKIEKKHDWEVFTVTDMTDFAQVKTAPGLKQGFFDREVKAVYTIVIEAYQEKTPKLKSTAVLIINVRDENDSPPVFEQSLYTAAPIPENVDVPYVVPNIKVNATDKDILENAEVYYFITSGNDGRFSMETVFGQDQQSYGKLTVTSPLDARKTDEFKRDPVYRLTVTATDRKHTATATIVVRILDRPDTKPEFLEPYYEKYLPENAGPGIPVIQVKVKPPDEDQSNIKPVILFKLDDIAKPYFVINERTGLISTADEPLDWETTPVITFPVYAYEQRSPNITGQTFVRVKVNDANDAPPLFPDQPYVGYIRENMPVGTLVRYVNGIDRDNPDINNGRNVRLTYELLKNTGEDPFDKDAELFNFDSKGRLTTKVMLNAEEFRRNLSIRIRAWDDGNPRLYGETDVTIVVLDQSEFPAWFRKEKYEASVSETQPPGFVVLQLTTKDQDFTRQNNYAFSIKSGNTPYAFDINQDTGEIVVAGVLDNEEGKRQYKLTVGLRERSDELAIKFGIGSDGLVKAFEHTAVVTITITDGNDNRPTFSKPTYSKTISENTPVGKTLDLDIEATDDDVGFSNEFRFVRAHQ